MVADKIIGLVQGSSILRAMFEEGRGLAGIFGPENVYDFSLESPRVELPKKENRYGNMEK